MANLALSRRPGESLDIDGPATVKVVRIDGNRVILMITAPLTTTILRDDIKTRKFAPPCLTAQSRGGSGEAIEP